MRLEGIFRKEVDTEEGIETDNGTSAYQTDDSGVICVPSTLSYKAHAKLKSISEEVFFKTLRWAYLIIDITTVVC